MENKTIKENLKDLDVLTTYISKVKYEDLEHLNTIYNKQFDPQELFKMISDPLYLDFILRFFSLALLTKMSELIDEEKKKIGLN
jgi:hypothetical protein